MVRNKLRHVAVGLAVAGVGVAGVLLFDGWYPVRVLSALLFVAGVAWAVVMGHLPFLLLSLLAIGRLGDFVPGPDQRLGEDAANQFVVIDV